MTNGEFSGMASIAPSYLLNRINNLISNIVLWILNAEGLDNTRTCLRHSRDNACRKLSFPGGFGRNLNRGDARTLQFFRVLDSDVTTVAMN
jgi:hypothetical protein